MALQFSHDAVIAKARRAAVQQRCAKTFLRQPIVFFKEIEHGIHIVSLFGIAGQLAAQFESAVLAHREITQGTAFQA